jgi:hypothetical protein
MSNELVTLDTMERMADWFVKSRLFGIETKEQAVSLMMLCQAEGIHPAIALRDYHIIKGRHCMKADTMLARFQQAGGVIEWKDYTDTKCAALFSHPVHCPKPVLVDWTIERAKQAGITGKDNWRNYPRQMLRARVISDGIKTTFPIGSIGIYTPEELQDIDDAPKTMKPAVSMPKAVVDAPKIEAPKAEDAVVVIEKSAEGISSNSIVILGKIQKDLGVKDFNEVLGWNNYQSVTDIPNDAAVAELIKQFKARRQEMENEKK